MEEYHTRVVLEKELVNILESMPNNMVVSVIFRKEDEGEEKG